MSTVDSEAPSGVTTTADALRAVADWLDAHPDETAKWGHVSLRAGSREDLQRIADAFGDTAAEHADSYRVSIERHFGTIHLYADCYWQELGVEVKTVTPEYEPILGARP